MNPNVNLIGLEVYRDVTTPFKRTTDLFCFFLPFLTIRQHYHCGKKICGMHLFAFDVDLWINGIIGKGIKSCVAITGVTLDGRELQVF
jgi:hypothetical protein